MDMNSLKGQVREILDLVPREPGTLLPQGATEQEIAEFEHVMRFSLPVELKDWLSSCNGPCVGPGGLYGIAPAPRWLTIEDHWEPMPEWKVRGWIPVAGDGVGNQYILDSHSGSGDQHPIYFLDHEASLLQPVYIVASNLWQFLRFLLQTELDQAQGKRAVWPFQEAVVLTADPGLEQYRNRVPFPWETSAGE